MVLACFFLWLLQNSSKMSRFGGKCCSASKITVVWHIQSGKFDTHVAMSPKVHKITSLVYEKIPNCKLMTFLSWENRWMWGHGVPGTAWAHAVPGTVWAECLLKNAQMWAHGVPGTAWAHTVPGTVWVHGASVDGKITGCELMPFLERRELVQFWEGCEFCSWWISCAVLQGVAITNLQIRTCISVFWSFNGWTVCEW